MSGLNHNFNFAFTASYQSYIASRLFDDMHDDYLYTRVICHSNVISSQIKIQTSCAHESILMATYSTYAYHHAYAYDQLHCRPDDSLMIHYMFDSAD